MNYTYTNDITEQLERDSTWAWLHDGTCEYRNPNTIEEKTGTITSINGMPAWLKANTPERVHLRGYGVVSTADAADGGIYVHVMWNTDLGLHPGLPSSDWKAMWANPTPEEGSTMDEGASLCDICEAMAVVGGETVCDQCKEEDIMEEGLFVVAGTGSRSLQTATPAAKKAVMEYLTQQFTSLKEKYGDNLRIMTGMAEGFDTAMARVALNLDIKYIAVIPNKGYGRYYWMNNSVTGTNRYREFTDYLSNADEVVYVMEDVHRSNDLYLNGVHSNFVRNDYMVECANAFYVYDPKSRGTAHCFDLIKKAELPYKLVPVQA